MSDLRRLTGLIPKVAIDDQDSPTYECSDCLDTGYTHRDTDAGQLASPCFCHRGDVLEAGRRFELCYPFHDGKRRPDHCELAKLDDIVVRRGVPAERVRKLVREMLHAYNTRMKRTIQE